jgi:hypothetical protein
VKLHDGYSLSQRERVRVRENVSQALPLPYTLAAI